MQHGTEVRRARQCWSWPVSKIRGRLRRSLRARPAQTARGCNVCKQAEIATCIFLHSTPSHQAFLLLTAHLLEMTQTPQVLSMVASAAAIAAPSDNCFGQLRVGWCHAGARHVLPGENSDQPAHRNTHTHTLSLVTGGMHGFPSHTAEPSGHACETSSVSQAGVLRGIHL